MEFLFINWNPDPTLFEIGPITFRWYGVLFALGLVVGFQLVKKVFLHDGLNDKQIDNILYVTVAGTVIGARLGHVFFYDWEYYSENLAEIPQIWRGGLASHGGGLGIILAIWLYSKFGIKKHVLWSLDRLTIAVSTGSIFIRFGNLMNSEIVGNTTDLPWAFSFVQFWSDELKQFDPTPRHPAQLYEAISWMLVLGLMLYFYWKTNKKNNKGFMFGMFLSIAFTFRFLIEFVKNSQGGFEENFGNILSTGQWLSIPFVIIGIILIVFSRNNNSTTPELT